MKIDNLVSIINLLNVTKIGPQKVLALGIKFNDLNEIFRLSEKELCSVDGIDQKSAKVIKSYNDFDYGKRIIENTIKSKINIISFWDENYPKLLKKIYDPPVLLFTKGQPLDKQEDSVAIVGTRNSTQYGKKVAIKLAGEIYEIGISIISGLANGIDTVAHTTTVQNDCRTIAVLGSGLDIIYPSNNKKLAEQILEKGTIISEFPIGTKPDAGNFPRRNRIISGMSHATIVVEAGNKSGAILTALNAIDQNREVFAVPGRIDDKQSQGCIRLIRNGAVPAQSGKQVVEYIRNRLFKHVAPTQQRIRLELTNEERSIIQYISNDPIHIDILNNKSEIGITKLLGILLELELKGAITQVGGKQFVLA